MKDSKTARNTHLGNFLTRWTSNPQTQTKRDALLTVVRHFQADSMVTISWRQQSFVSKASLSFERAQRGGIKNAINTYGKIKFVCSIDCNTFDPLLLDTLYNCSSLLPTTVLCSQCKVQCKFIKRSNSQFQTYKNYSLVLGYFTHRY